MSALKGGSGDDEGLGRANRDIQGSDSARPTYIARRAIRATRRTGTAGRASLFAESRWMRSGSAS